MAGGATAALHHTSSGSLVGGGGGGNTTPTTSASHSPHSPHSPQPQSLQHQQQSLVSTFKSATQLSAGGGTSLANAALIANGIVAGALGSGSILGGGGGGTGGADAQQQQQQQAINMPGGIVTPGTPKAKVRRELRVSSKS